MADDIAVLDFLTTLKSIKVNDFYVIISAEADEGPGGDSSPPFGFIGGVPPHVIIVPNPPFVFGSEGISSAHISSPGKAILKPLAHSKPSEVADQGWACWAMSDGSAGIPENCTVLSSPFGGPFGGVDGEALAEASAAELSALGGIPLIATGWEWQYNEGWLYSSGPTIFTVNVGKVFSGFYGIQMTVYKTQKHKIVQNPSSTFAFVTPADDPIASLEKGVQPGGSAKFVIDNKGNIT